MTFSAAARRFRNRALMGLCGLSLIVPFAAPTPASASVFAYCDEWGFIDPLGFYWDDGDENGSINDGNNDAFDGYGYLTVDGETYYPDYDRCGREDGREVTFGASEMSGLQVSRKVYVPATGQAFVRWLDTLHNPTDQAITVSVGFDGNLGSDGSTVVLGTTNGDTVVDPSDGWIVTDEENWIENEVPGEELRARAATGDDPWGDPSVGHLLDAERGPVAKRLDGYVDAPGGFVDEESYGNDNVAVAYDDVTVAPGETKTFMHLALQRVDRASALADTRALAQAPVEVFANMTLDEADQVQNWPASDFDADGVGNRQDNCLNDANADQADLDRDGQGDACDADIDGDGLSNAAEADLGLNPRSADTDGDGVNDKADGCPKVAGSENGCPPNVIQVIQASQQDRSRVSPLSVSLRAGAARVSGRGVRVTARGTVAPPKGLSAAQACTSGRVAVIVKHGKKTVSTRFAKLAADCSYGSSVTFGAHRRLAGRKLTVRARFIGNSVLERRTSAARAVRAS